MQQGFARITCCRISWVGVSQLLTDWRGSHIRLNKDLNKGVQINSWPPCHHRLSLSETVFWCSDLQMEHISCSRQHAEFLWSDNLLWIKDLDSTHGTYMAIATGPRHKLPPGKNIRIDAEAKITMVCPLTYIIISLMCSLERSCEYHTLERSFISLLKRAFPVMRTLCRSACLVSRLSASIFISHGDLKSNLWDVPSSCPLPTQQIIHPLATYDLRCLARIDKIHAKDTIWTCVPLLPRARSPS